MSAEKIVLSAATLASALSALGVMNQSGIQAAVDVTENRYTLPAQAAVANSQAQRYIYNSVPMIAQTVSLDGQLMSERYMIAAAFSNSSCPYDDFLQLLYCRNDAPKTYNGTPKTTDPRRNMDPLLNDSSIDDMKGGDNFELDTFSCYTNCHNACHGSRGWR
jgi:hypothetical protein